MLRPHHGAPLVSLSARWASRLLAIRTCVLCFVPHFSLQIYLRLFSLVPQCFSPASHRRQLTGPHVLPSHLSTRRAGNAYTSPRLWIMNFLEVVAGLLKSAIAFPHPNPSPPLLTPLRWSPDFIPTFYTQTFIPPFVCFSSQSQPLFDNSKPSSAHLGHLAYLSVVPSKRENDTCSSLRPTTRLLRCVS